MEANVFNSILFIGTVVFYLGGMLGAYKLFGKAGLYVWTAFGVIVSSIEALVQCTMFSMPLTLGNALYASSFTVTDILSEKYGKREANTAVNIGLFTTLVWVAATQLIISFIPSGMDLVMPALRDIFGFVPRLSVASIFTYAVTQRVDVVLYHWWWKKTGHTDKFLWLRNNGSTLISQFVDTVVFTMIAFLGVYDLPYVGYLCMTTYAMKVIVALFDTPCVYLARKIKPLCE